MLTRIRFRTDYSASSRPKDTAFRQQRLPAWQPILTIHSSLPLYFVIGMLFIPIGIVCLMASNKVQTQTINYTDCRNMNGDLCSSVIDFNILTQCVCHERFTLTENFTGNVYFYYGLEQYWQNLRRYVDSRDDNQLLGSLNAVNSDTKPYRNPPNSSSTFYAPAGAIANSFFNDSFSLTKLGTDQDLSINISVPWTGIGIAWETDVAYKFRNPPTFKDTIKPVNWRKPVNELDTSRPDNNGYQNQDLIVWMRGAAFPTFRKLYRILDRSEAAANLIFKESLPKGEYILTIIYNYPVAVFKGRKIFTISTTSWLGSKNPFLGYALICVGSVSILTGIIFIVLHVNFGDRDSSATVQTRSCEMFDC